MIKYCLPIIAKDPNLIVQTICAQLDHYQYFEIWLDYLEDLDLEWVENLLEHYGQRVIVLFRRKNLEPIKLSLAQRKKIIEIVANYGAILDLDIASQNEELNYLREKNILPTLLLSYHNYYETPADEELRFILTEMKSRGAWCRKIATMCNSREDALRLLSLQQDLLNEGDGLATGANLIVLGMGQHGVITRIFASLWGNAMCFAPISLAEQTASGQYTRAQYEAIFGLLYSARA